MRRSEHEIFADYRQFYIQDEGASGDLSDAWTEEATARLLAIAPGCIGVGTVRSQKVPVTIEFADAEPADALESWDHVVDASIDLPSGRLVLAGCTDYFPDAARYTVAPGYFRVRVFYVGLSSLSSDGLDGDDRYRLVIWPGEETAPRVLKDGAPRD